MNSWPILNEWMILCNRIIIYSFFLNKSFLLLLIAFVSSCFLLCVSDSWADPRARQLWWRAAPCLLATNIWHAHIWQEIPWCSSCSSTEVINFLRAVLKELLKHQSWKWGQQVLVHFSHSSLNWCPLVFINHSAIPVEPCVCGLIAKMHVIPFLHRCNTH